MASLSLCQDRGVVRGTGEHSGRQFLLRASEQRVMGIRHTWVPLRWRKIQYKATGWAGQQTTRAGLS